MVGRPALLLLLWWLGPAPQAGWEPVGQGDCPGPQVRGGAGATPEPELCTAAFAGKTALCFPQVCNPGCQYIDVLTGACPAGNEHGQLYTCVPEAAQ